MRVFKSAKPRAVYLPEIDDEHHIIFRTVSELRRALDSDAPQFQIDEILHRLIAAAEDHFTHEEKLMRAFHYVLLSWHKKQHDTVRNRMKEYAPRVEAGDRDAGNALIEFITNWLRDHTGVTDQMMAAYLRNQQRAQVN